MADSETLNPISIGLDDGYAFTKVAIPDGRLIAIPSRARIGRSNVTWLNGSEQRVFEYETDDTLFAVGEVDGEPTHFDGYPFSGLNRAIVQHALHEAGLLHRLRRCGDRRGNCAARHGRRQHCAHHANVTCTAASRADA